MNENRGTVQLFVSSSDAPWLRFCFSNLGFRVDTFSYVTDKDGSAPVLDYRGMTIRGMENIKQFIIQEATSTERGLFPHFYDIL